MKIILTCVWYNFYLPNFDEVVFLSSSFGTQFILSPKRPLVASLLWVCKPLFFLSHLRRFFLCCFISGVYTPACAIPSLRDFILQEIRFCLFLNKIQYLAKIVIFFELWLIFGRKFSFFLERKYSFFLNVNFRKFNRKYFF